MMKLYTMNELIDRDLGPVGTTERDDFEKKVSDDIHAYYITKVSHLQINRT